MTTETKKANDEKWTDLFLYLKENSKFPNKFWNLRLRHVLKMFLIFQENPAWCSYNCRSYKKNCVYTDKNKSGKVNQISRLTQITEMIFHELIKIWNVIFDFHECISKREILTSFHYINRRKVWYHHKKVSEIYVWRDYHEK